MSTFQGYDWCTRRQPPTRPDRGTRRLPPRSRLCGHRPLTGKRVYKRDTIKGTDDASRKLANKRLNKLLVEVDEQSSPSSSVAFGDAVDEWMRRGEIEACYRPTRLTLMDRT